MEVSVPAEVRAVPELLGGAGVECKTVPRQCLGRDWLRFVSPE